MYIAPFSLCRALLDYCFSFPRLVFLEKKIPQKIPVRATVMGVVGYGVVGLSYLMADHLSALEASLSSTKP